MPQPTPFEHEVMEKFDEKFVDDMSCGCSACEDEFGKRDPNHYALTLFDEKGDSLCEPPSHFDIKDFILTILREREAQHQKELVEARIAGLEWAIDNVGHYGEGRFADEISRLKETINEPKQ